METFEAALSEEQLGLFLAIQNDPECDDKLMDVLTAPQYELYLKAKKPAMSNFEPTNNSATDYQFNNPLLDKFKSEKDFVWLDIWRKSQDNQGLKDFDVWRDETLEEHFLSLLTNKEYGKFCGTTSVDQVMDIVKTLQPEKQLVYNQWKQKPISTTPPFYVHLNLAGIKKKMFTRMVDSRNFEALDSYMEGCPDYKQMYEWWKTAIIKAENPNSEKLTTVENETSRDSEQKQHFGAQHQSSGISDSVMDIFKNSLTDEQLGVFLAVQYEPNCDEKLFFLLDSSQYQLYLNTKANDATTKQAPTSDVVKKLRLNNTRRLIELLSKPLAEIAQSIIINENIVKRRTRKEVLSRQKIPYPKTVCYNPSCVTFEKVDGQHRAVFKECHAHCYLQGVQTMTIRNPILRDCWAMNGSENCHLCEHSRKEHMHIRYEIVKKLMKVENKFINELLKDKTTEMEAGQRYIKELKEKNVNYNRQKEQITTYCAVFASFLEKNSIIVYNDGFKECIQYLIEEEKTKVSRGYPADQYLLLEGYAAEYEVQATLIRESAKLLGAHQETVEDINEKIEQLMQMDNYGTFLQDVWRLELLVAGTTTEKLSQKIELGCWKRTLQMNS